MNQDPLISGSFYHIYNRANSGSLLFYNNNHYKYFINKFKEYLFDSVSIYSYCLIPNHFHFLIKINENLDPIIISQKFSNLFNSYTKTINKDQKRHGSLFEKPFKRKLINNELHLGTIINYIHRNPIHHKICENVSEYLWSSYHDIINKNNNFVDITELFTFFKDVDDFKLLTERIIEDYKELQIE